MLTVRVPERDRNKCGRVTGPKPERVRSIFAGVNATRTSGTGPERDRNANRNRCEHGLRLSYYQVPGTLDLSSDIPTSASDPTPSHRNAKTWTFRPKNIDVSAKKE